MKKFLAVIFLMVHVVAIQAQNVIYVSPDGSDKSRGTVAKPFRTISRALQAARKQTGPTTIYLRQGAYRLTAPIVFTPEDGDGKRTLSLRSFPGEQVVVSGGEVVETHWKPYNDSVFCTTIDSPLGRIDMLLVNGESRIMARFPNYDPDAVRFNGTSADATAPHRVKGWQCPEGGYLHAMHASDWGDFHYRIMGKDAEGNLKLVGGWQNNRPAPLHKNNRMVEGVFEELDAPGEWYHDTVKHMLYYFPLPGEDVKSLVFETPRTKHLFEFRGSIEKPVRGISIEGVSMTQTSRTFMENYEPLLRSDWTIYRGGAVLMEGTEDCAVRNCDLKELGGNAIFVSRYNRRVTIEGCHFTEIGASAICLVGSADAVRSPSFRYGQYVQPVQLDRTSGPRTEDYPAYCCVRDNLIHRIGRHEKQITGVELSMSSHITVSHNSIYDTPRAGINVSEGTWGGHVIEHNDVFDTVKETGDHGSFNSWGRDRFWHPNRSVMDSLAAVKPSLVLKDAISPTILRHNRFRCDRGWDIDLDDGSSNYLIQDNLCLNGGIKLREGFFRTVMNNILVNNTFHPHVWFRQSGDVFVRNVVMTPYQPIQVGEWGLEIDYNIFADSTAYRSARSRGTDAHSVVIPVRFVNPQKGDFRLEDAATAARIGFHNYDMTDFGVVSPRLRALARVPQFPQLISATSTKTSDAITWQGVKVKNLTTLGERSATGMDSERGVYVISLETLGCPLRDYLRPNDVILELDGYPVNGCEDLQRATKQMDLQKQHTITVFRMQREVRIALPPGILR